MMLMCLRHVIPIRHIAFVYWSHFLSDTMYRIMAVVFRELYKYGSMHFSLLFALSVFKMLEMFCCSELMYTVVHKNERTFIFRITFFGKDRPILIILSPL